MDARRFCSFVFAISTAIVLAMVAVNYYLDIFGLFKDVKDRSVSIYSDERTSKYLLAFHYVPENFEAYIMGPSLSANLDPKKIKHYRIYNLSMMGANITEQKAVVQKAMESATPRFVIVCLHPYLTADHGMKTGMINPREYYGALGSISLYKTYLLKIIRDNRLFPGKFPPDQFNDYGSNHYNSLLQKMPVEEKIKEQLSQDDAIRTDIDSVAWNEFNELMDELHGRKVEIIAYFHPLPFPIYDKFRAQLNAYQLKMIHTLKDKAVIIDFNSPQYEAFTKDLGNYIDHGHLSDQGETFVMREILRQSHHID